MIWRPAAITEGRGPFLDWGSGSALRPGGWDQAETVPCAVLTEAPWQVLCQSPGAAEVADAVEEAVMVQPRDLVTESRHCSVGSLPPPPAAASAATSDPDPELLAGFVAGADREAAPCSGVAGTPASLGSGVQLCCAAVCIRLGTLGSEVPARPFRGTDL